MAAPSARPIQYTSLAHFLAEAIRADRLILRVGLTDGAPTIVAAGASDRVPMMFYRELFAARFAQAVRESWPEVRSWARPEPGDSRLIRLAPAGGSAPRLPEIERHLRSIAQGQPVTVQPSSSVSSTVAAKPLLRRVLVDIDSTLYDMLPVLSDCAQRLFGIRFAPAEVNEWDYWAQIGLTLPQWLATIEASHARGQILANAPFPGSVVALRRWVARGVVIHVVSDRGPASFEATHEWLRRIGVPAKEIFLAPRVDKVAYVREHHIDLVIDDKPSLISALAEANLPIAALIYGYNQAVITEQGNRVMAATNWPDLARQIERRFALPGATA